VACLTSSPDRHTLPQWSGQVLPGAANSYISSKPFAHSLFIALMMEAVCTSETSFYFETTLHYIPRNHHITYYCTHCILLILIVETS